MKVKLKDAEKDAREMSPNVESNAVLVGKRMLVWLVRIEGDGVIPRHSHPHEQVSICLRGEAESRFKRRKRTYKAGDVTIYASREKHGPFRAVRGGSALFLDIFSPPRRDFLKLFSARRFYSRKSRYSRLDRNQTSRST